jgi:hypothetical protein
MGIKRLNRVCAEERAQERMYPAQNPAASSALVTASAFAGFR